MKDPWKQSGKANSRIFRKHNVSISETSGAQQVATCTVITCHLANDKMFFTKSLSQSCCSTWSVARPPPAYKCVNGRRKRLGLIRIGTHETVKEPDTARDRQTGRKKKLVENEGHSLFLPDDKDNYKTIAKARTK